MGFITMKPLFGEYVSLFVEASYAANLRIREGYPK